MILTESQRKAIAHDGRNLQLIACAGFAKLPSISGTVRIHERISLDRELSAGLEPAARGRAHRPMPTSAGGLRSAGGARSRLRRRATRAPVGQAIGPMSSRYSRACAAERSPRHRSESPPCRSRWPPSYINRTSGGGKRREYWGWAGSTPKTSVARGGFESHRPPSEDIDERPAAEPPRVYRGNQESRHRLYAGATPSAPVGRMFSFFPCLSADAPKGFPRPSIRLDGRINPRNWRRAPRS